MTLMKNVIFISIILQTQTLGLNEEGADYLKDKITIYHQNFLDDALR